MFISVASLLNATFKSILKSMKRATVAGLVFCFLSLVFTACWPERPSGCIDPAAVNYQRKVNEDNSLCRYQGLIAVWFDNATRDSMLANGIDAVIPFIDDSNFLNIYPQHVQWADSLDCWNNTIYLGVDLGRRRSAWTPVFVAYDSISQVVFSDSLFVEGGNCVGYQVVW